MLRVSQEAQEAWERLRSDVPTAEQLLVVSRDLLRRLHLIQKSIACSLVPGDISRELTLLRGYWREAFPSRPALLQGENFAMFQVINAVTHFISQLEEQDPQPIVLVNIDKVSPKPKKPATRDTKLDERDKWIYNQCCKRIAYDKIVADLKRKAKSKKWKVFSSKNRAQQIGIEYAKRNGLPKPPSRQGL